MIPKVFPIEIQRKYLRIPFVDKGRSFQGCDCGGLVWLIYKNELGINFPDGLETYDNTSIEHRVDVADAVSSVLRKYYKEVPIEEAQPFDVLCLKIANQDMHVAVVVSQGKMIHIMEGRTPTPTVESYSSIQWRTRVAGCFKYVG